MTAPGGRGPATALSRPMPPLMLAGSHRSALHIPVIGDKARRSA
jgi:hypothetical protein